MQKRAKLMHLDSYKLNLNKLCAICPETRISIKLAQSRPNAGILPGRPLWSHLRQGLGSDRICCIIQLLRSDKFSGIFVGNFRHMAMEVHNQSVFMNGPWACLSCRSFRCILSSWITGKSGAGYLRSRQSSPRCDLQTLTDYNCSQSFAISLGSWLILIATHKPQPPRVRHMSLLCTVEKRLKRLRSIYTRSWDSPIQTVSTISHCRNLQGPFMNRLRFDCIAEPLCPRSLERMPALPLGSSGSHTSRPNKIQLQAGIYPEAASRQETVCCPGWLPPW